MYKCGWNGCEKAYGTLNHLNAHVTMQSHGAKRTPEGMQFLPIPCLVFAMKAHALHRQLTCRQQNSRRSEKNGRPERRRRRMPEKLKKSASVKLQRRLRKHNRELRRSLVIILVKARDTSKTVVA